MSEAAQVSISTKASTRYLWFDLIRGISAIAVCAGHLRAALFVDLADVKQPGILVTVLYLLTGLGHQAVIIFFVLSGYFVGGGLLQKKDRWRWKPYLITRMTRLWIVLIPALILTLIVDQLIAQGGIPILQGALYDKYKSGPTPGEYSSTAATFIGNILFCQTIFCPVYGTNSPLWSLANEFWYYILFPLIVSGVSIAQKRTTASRIGYGIATALVIYAMPLTMLKGFLIWCLGAAMAVLQQRTQHKNSYIYLFMPAAIFGGALYYSKSMSLQNALEIEADFIVGIGFFLFAFALLTQGDFIRSIGKAQKIIRYISEISYSLYLYHFPVVILLIVRVYGSDQIQPDMKGIIQYILWLSIILMGGMIFWWLFEKRTDSVKEAIQRRWLIQDKQKKSQIPRPWGMDKYITDKK